MIDKSKHYCTFIVIPSFSVVNICIIIMLLSKRIIIKIQNHTSNRNKQYEFVSLSISKHLKSIALFIVRLIVVLETLWT